jgi:hypothetical protein
MKLLCLCPTYGRRRELLENSLACFVTQVLPAEDRHLVFFDDLGTLEECHCRIDNVTILSQSARCPSIASKYNVMLDRLTKRGFDVLDFDYDAVVVWDDDDVYLPYHLQAHAAALTMTGVDWSKPSRIWSAYHQPAEQECAAGRFHGSLAITKSLLHELGGWIETKRADFDQQMISALAAKSVVYDTNHFVDSPQYVYRWGSSNSGHCSGLMEWPGDELWYEDFRPDSTEPIHTLKPCFDDDTIALQARCLTQPFHTEVIDDLVKHRRSELALTDEGYLAV